MKRYKKGYIEVCGNEILASISKITVTEEDGLEEIDEDPFRTFGGWESIEEAVDYLKSVNCKEIEIER
jgi:hypothetical protein